jgi:hypothetical protein
MLFVKLSFTLATEEAERIGLDHVSLATGKNKISAGDATLIFHWLRLGNCDKF